MCVINALHLQHANQKHAAQHMNSVCLAMILATRLTSVHAYIYVPKIQLSFLNEHLNSLCLAIILSTRPMSVDAFITVRHVW